MTENTDAPENVTKEQLWNRLKRLEEHVYPSRRELLAGGASALLAGGAVKSMSGRSRAADTSAGQAGAAGQEIDVFIDELRDPGGDVVADVDDTGAVNWQGRSFENVGSIGTDEARISGPVYLGDSTRDGSEEFINESIGWKTLIGVDSQGNQGAVLTLRIDYNGLDASGTDVINVDTSQGITTGTNSSEWGSTGDVISVASDVRFKVDDNNAEILFVQVYVPDNFWFGSVSYSTTTRQTDYV